MSLQYPHLIFENFTTPLGKRVMDGLRWRAPRRQRQTPSGGRKCISRRIPDPLFPLPHPNPLRSQPPPPKHTPNDCHPHYIYHSFFLPPLGFTLCPPPPLPLPRHVCRYFGQVVGHTLPPLFVSIPLSFCGLLSCLFDVNPSPPPCDKGLLRQALSPFLVLMDSPAMGLPACVRND